LNAIQGKNNQKIVGVLVRNFSDLVASIQSCQNGAILVTGAPSDDRGFAVQAFVDSKAFEALILRDTLPNSMRAAEVRFSLHDNSLRWQACDAIEFDSIPGRPPPCATVGRQTIAEVLEIMPESGSTTVTLRCVITGFTFTHKVPSSQDAVGLNQLVLSFVCGYPPKTCSTHLLGIAQVAERLLSEPESVADCGARYSAHVSRLTCESHALNLYGVYPYAMPVYETKTCRQDILMDAEGKPKSREQQRMVDIALRSSGKSTAPGNWCLDDPNNHEVAERLSGASTTFAHYVGANTYALFCLSEPKEHSPPVWREMVTFPLDATLQSLLENVACLNIRRSSGRAPSTPLSSLLQANSASTPHPSGHTANGTTSEPPTLASPHRATSDNHPGLTTAFTDEQLIHFATPTLHATPLPTSGNEMAYGNATADPAPKPGAAQVTPRKTVTRPLSGGIQPSSASKHRSE
jgi:hypothetical protein